MQGGMGCKVVCAGVWGAGSYGGGVCRGYGCRVVWGLGWCVLGYGV